MVARYSSELENKALNFARNAHNGQFRKYSNSPYIVHPVSVADFIGLNYKQQDTNLICAALLHDVVEDCGVTIEELQQEFNEDIANLVFWVTKKSKTSDGNRATRKRIDHEFLARAPDRAQTLKLCDRYCNLNDTLFDDSPVDFAEMYLRETQDLLNYMQGGDEYIRSLVMYMMDLLDKKLNGEFKLKSREFKNVRKTDNN